MMFDKNTPKRGDLVRVEIKPEIRDKYKAANGFPVGIIVAETELMIQVADKKHYWNLLKCDIANIEKEEDNE